jgi:hypothetical protein
VFDASRSTGFVTYRWTLTMPSNELTINQPEGTPVFTPATTCSFLGGGSLNSDGTVTMAVTLQVRDRQGNTSTTGPRNISVVPGGQCGY